MGNIEILKKKVFNTRGAHFQVALNKQVFIFLFTVEYRRLCCWVPVYYVWNGPSRSFDILPSTTLLLLLIWISFQNLLLLLRFRLGFFFSLSFFREMAGKGEIRIPEMEGGRERTSHRNSIIKCQLSFVERDLHFALERKASSSSSSSSKCQQCTHTSRAPEWDSGRRRISKCSTGRVIRQHLEAYSLYSFWILAI